VHPGLILAMGHSASQKGSGKFQISPRASQQRASAASELTARGTLILLGWHGYARLLLPSLDTTDLTSP
jgi:hypothetical protein